MKRTNVLLSFLLLFLGATLLVSAQDEKDKNLTNIPDNVKTVIKNSCFGCHNSGSRNEDAKDELSFDKLNDLSKIKKISAYKHIGETIEENEMPPKRFLEKKPEKALSEADKKIVLEWAKKEAESLVKN